MIKLKNPNDVRERIQAVGASELKAMLEVKEKYYQLLYAVSIKHPNETRYETALRYIKQAERQPDRADAAQTSNRR